MFAVELATNSTVTSSVDPLVYPTWALVIASSIAVIVSAILGFVAARQNRETQRIMRKQVDQEIAQTQLQQRQFEALLKPLRRERVEELIQIILSPAMLILDVNAVRGREAQLEPRSALLDFVTDKNAKYYNRRAYWVFRDFEADDEYKDLATRMKEYDRGAVDSVRLRHIGLQDVLRRKVREALPAMIEKFGGTPDDLDAKIDLIPPFIVDNGILMALRNLPEQFPIPGRQQPLPALQEFWQRARSDFLALTSQPEVVTAMDTLKSANSDCAKASDSLNGELSSLVSNLGTEYGITRDRYFQPRTHEVVIEDRYED